MNVSVASYAFHGLLREGKMDVFGYLESCKYRYGLQTADLWTGMLPVLDDACIARVRDALRERDLTLVNLCVDGPHLWEDDPAVREKHYRDALNYLRIGETLGARTIRIDAGGRGETFTDEQLDWIVARYREYAQRAHDNGYRVGPENHWGTETVPEQMKRLCEAVNHPGFGILLHFRGTPGDAVIAPWAVHTHIMWQITEECLGASMTMLRDAGYKGCWAVEHHTGKNEYTEVAIQLAKVRDVLDRWRLGAEG